MNSSDDKKPFQKFYKDNKKKADTKNLRKFEESDLSFGKKRKKPTVILKEEPEVTFQKELKNKWELKPTGNFPEGGADFKHKKSQDKNFKHQHPPKKKGLQKYMDEPNSVESVYLSKKPSGNRKKKENTNDYNNAPESGLMPLNKYISHCDVCGRREAADLVRQGKVKVNGILVAEPGHKVTSKDKITLSGKKLFLQHNSLYILLNKPKGFITTTDDPKGRRTVMDIFKNQIEERIYPIGRLDRQTTGLLLLTNDGQLSQKLAHPSQEIKKVYQVTIDKVLSTTDFDKIKAGLVLEDGSVEVDQLAYLDNKNELGLEIHIGRNRIVRRMFESLGYKVIKLDRVMYAGLTKKDIPRGKWRFLTKQEVINLKHFK